MSTRTIKLADAEKYFGQKLGPAMIKGAKRGLVSAAARATQEVVTKIIPQLIPSPVDRGTYKAGWDYGEDSDGAWFGNMSPHAPLLEWGVRAKNVRVSRAMIDALTEWVKRKGLGSGVIARRIAFAIATSQKMRGVFNKGKGFRVLDKIGKRLPHIIEVEVRREIEREIGKICATHCISFWCRPYPVFGFDRNELV